MVDGRDPPTHIIVHVIFLFYLMVYAYQKRSEYLHHVIAQD